MKIKNSRFVGSAANKAQYPAPELPEIAVVGRSNVGKSSIINMLLGRKGLVKTSATPGKTKLVNFFDIDGKFRFVDLPGYGFANVSKSVRHNWGRVVGEYLGTRENLLEIMLLLDIRHSPTEDDLTMIDWIRKSGYRGILVATKGDKLGRERQHKQTKAILEKLQAVGEPIYITSALNRQGKYEVWDAMNALFEEKDLGIYFEKQQEERSERK